MLLGIEVKRSSGLSDKPKYRFDFGLLPAFDLEHF